MRCAGCGKRVKVADAVRLGRHHGFCSLTCRDAWAVDNYLHMAETMNRIFIRCRGKARELALAALRGNFPSVGGGE